MRQDLSKKLKQIIARDHINDRERLAAIKFMSSINMLTKIFYASSVSQLLEKQ